MRLKQKLMVPVILALTSVIVSGCSASITGNQKYSLSKDQKKAMAQYSYNLLNAHFDGNEVSTPNELINIDNKYYKIYITFLINGETRCSQSGTAEKSRDDRISQDLRSAVENCIKDDRFGGPTKKDDLDKINIVVDVLYNPQRLKGNSIDDLKNEIELGINALRVEKDGNGANFKNSVPISKNFTLKQTLESLCKKDGLDSSCYTDKTVDKYKYDSITFLAPRDKDTVDLYRYDKLISEKDISQDSIRASIEGGYSWLKNDVDPKTNLLQYMYYPSQDKYATQNNDIRRLAASWAGTELMSYLQNEDLKPMVRATIKYYLQDQKRNDDGLYIDLGDDAKIAYNAFLIMALVNSPNYPGREILMRQLADAILGQQQEDGSYNTDFLKKSTTGTDYYPGESMLALMKLYNATKDEKYLGSVKKAFPYYRDYWRKNKNTAFIPWHTQTYKLLYEISPDKELADFVYEMNDWIINSEQQFKSDYPDYIGGFKEQPSNSTASYLEGLADAYVVAQKVGNNEHIEKYRKSIKLAARFVLQTQYTDRNIFYIKNPDKALGGFRQSLTNNQQRNDYTQHATLGLIKVYQNSIFK